MYDFIPVMILLQRDGKSGGGLHFRTNQEPVLANLVASFVRLANIVVNVQCPRQRISSFDSMMNQLNSNCDFLATCKGKRTKEQEASDGVNEGIRLKISDLMNQARAGCQSFVKNHRIAMEAHAQSCVTNQLKLISDFMAVYSKTGRVYIKEEDYSYMGPLKSGSIPSGQFRVTLADVESRRQHNATQMKPTPKAYPSPHGIFKEYNVIGEEIKPVEQFIPPPPVHGRELPATGPEPPPRPAETAVPSVSGSSSSTGTLQKGAKYIVKSEDVKT